MAVRLTSRGRFQTGPAAFSAGYRYTTRVPVFAWAVVREIDKKTASTQVTGLHMDDEGQICEACWSEGFLRYERLETTERPQSSGK